METELSPCPPNMLKPKFGHSLDGINLGIKENHFSNPFTTGYFADKKKAWSNCALLLIFEIANISRKGETLVP
ncbi:MAG: hypothetical protein M1820_004067 [Bogoriella megaspora]|nr:MAG: hypothetical protein M1820_004067 [Bogoriella megaspora]